MSVEAYQWYKTHATLYGFKSENIGPASVDLELGVRYTEKRPAWGARWRKTKIVSREHVLPADGAWFYPYRFYLCHTNTYIHVPNDHIAFLMLRSSPSRKGLGHAYSGLFDPGFHGEPTLEIYTHLPIFIEPYQRVVQITYCRLSEATERPYLGHYLGQRGPTEAYQGGRP